MFPSHRDLVPIFHCPLCPPGSLLTAPITLRCGHTICAAHVSSPRCPIPTCSAQRVHSPASPRVAFFPAPPDAQNLLCDDTPRGVDVRVNNIVQLLRPAAGPRDPPTHFPGPSGDSGDNDSDPDDEDPLPSPFDPPSRLDSPHRHRSGSTSLPDPIQDLEKALFTELTCEICFMLLFEPVTTPCQHIFCSKCLQRSLDHSMFCPLCRQQFPGFAYFQEQPLNKTILCLLLTAFPDEYRSRGEALGRGERDARLDTPIFVCQLSFPGMPTLLHFFEPRYRLMLRRCLENHTPTFGMIMPPRAAPMPGQGANGTEFGTMQEIKSVQMFADGRSMVETCGTHRFRVLEHGSIDGYLIGRVERIDDYDDDLAAWAARDDDSAPASPAMPVGPLPLPPPISLTRVVSPSPSATSSQDPATLRQFPSVPELLATCHAFMNQLHAGTAPWVVQRLNYTYGPQPPDTDPGAFSFWMGMVLPIDEHEKSKLLPVKSARLRLRMVVGWIEQLNSNWWFSSGCTVL